MLIDWFTVIAQLVNFLILVWLLKRFLYRPILDAIDAREKKIELALADADAKQLAARQERDEFKNKNEVFEQQRSALMEQATDEAKTERQRLLGEARQAADALGTKRHETLNSEALSLKQAITRRTQQEVFAIARKALRDLAGSSLEERMVAVFLQRLHDMDEAARANFALALQGTPEPIAVRTAFELPEALRQQIRQETHALFSPDAELPLHFEVVPELVSGIELSSNGQKLAWSIADYLVTMEDISTELLRSPTGQSSKAGTTSHG